MLADASAPADCSLDYFVDAFGRSLVAVSSAISALPPPFTFDVPTTTVSPSSIRNEVSMTGRPPAFSAFVSWVRFKSLMRRLTDSSRVASRLTSSGFAMPTSTCCRPLLT